MSYSISCDRKWQKFWQEHSFNEFKEDDTKDKLYVLEMFSYPSAANLHVGHWYNYSLSDSWARMKKMQNFNVFQPMGFDAFGLPAENYAIKTGIHPQDSTKQNIKTMEKQLLEMGAFFAWDHELITCNEDYYRWTQWLFLQLYKHNLAYRKKAAVNWCPSCQTVLANEQCENGHCERCHSQISRKNLTQWFFKITDYAQELLDGLDNLDWPEKTKKIQTNWIGRSKGASILFELDEKSLNLLNEDGKKLYNNALEVFTTKPDTLMGLSYLVMAPEHELAKHLATAEHQEAVLQYIEETAKSSEIDRQASNREVSGVFTGSYAIHPISGERLPIYLSDYVIATYGTGIVMAVPAHDERDWRFSVKFNIPYKCVIIPEEIFKNLQNSSQAEELKIQMQNLNPQLIENLHLPYCEAGRLCNCHHLPELNALSSDEAKTLIVAKLSALNKGKEKINFRLRDWLISRQRYWGAPIPIIYCKKCGTVPVPESELPVKLPYNVEFKPDGQSPLAKCTDFVHCRCPKCNAPATRDTDTLDTFVCSSWYYLRYTNPHNKEKAFDSNLVNKLLPVDKYIGGAEHAAMHLLYARFITKSLRDMKLLNFDEPFKSLIHQGIILGADGQKMSKSSGNTITPDTYIQEYGSDVFRLYLAFGFAYTEGGPWSDDGVKSIAKFISKLERLFENLKKDVDNKITVVPDLNDLYESYFELSTPDDKNLYYVLNNSIKFVTIDAEKFQFNTSLSRIMELNNAIHAYLTLDDSKKNRALLMTASLKMLQLLAPFAPHFAEEMWELMMKDKESYSSIFNTKWPISDEKALILDEIEIAVQINSKIVAKIMVKNDSDEAEVKSLALTHPHIQNLTQGKNIVKFIYIKGRIANFVVK